MRAPEPLSADENVLQTETRTGEECELEGRYEVDALPAGKRFQGTWLVLDDGRRFVLSYRPDPERFEFLDKRVRVRGRPYQPGSDTQHIRARHLQVTSIALAPGETAWPEPPRTIPAPPLVRRKAELDVAPRWVSLVGRLATAEEVPDEFFGRAVMQMEDETRVVVEPITVNEWQAFVGQVITVTGPLRRRGEDEGPGGFLFELGRPHVICAGVRPGCGMN
ncbi:MAG: hypothetical protein JXQ27_16760 [Acidobacteria bacterium]|nr:hypothetical protein [Acidobacteriota bacterium]